MQLPSCDKNPFFCTQLALAAQLKESNTVSSPLFWCRFEPIIYHIVYCNWLKIFILAIDMNIIAEFSDKTKVGISGGGWGVLQKNRDFALKILKKMHTPSQNYIIISCKYQKTLQSKVVKIYPDYAQSKGFLDISTRGLISNFSAPFCIF